MPRRWRKLELFQAQVAIYNVKCIARNTDGSFDCPAPATFEMVFDRAGVQVARVP